MRRRGFLRPVESHVGCLRSRPTAATLVTLRLLVDVMLVVRIQVDYHVDVAPSDPTRAVLRADLEHFARLMQGNVAPLCRAAVPFDDALARVVGGPRRIYRRVDLAEIDVYLVFVLSASVSGPSMLLVLVDVRRISVERVHVARAPVVEGERNQRETEVRERSVL